MRSTRLPSWIDRPWSRRLLGLGALPAPPHVFSLVPEGLRYAHLAPENGRVELMETQAVPLSPSAVKPGVLGGPLAEPDVFDDAVAALLAQVSSPPEEASLVLSDAWMRMAFIEIGDLPGKPREREEIFRWKLKRIVPYKIDDLRLDADEVRPLPRQEEPRRFVLLFALDALLDGLEDAFAEHGVRIGRLVSASAAARVALESRLSEIPLGGLALVRENGYTLLFCRDGEPVLYRFKSEVPTAGDGGPGVGTGVERDLRLTRGFLVESMPDLALEELWLLAPAVLESTWSVRLERSFGLAPRTVTAGDLGLQDTGPLSAARIAPMTGAVTEKIS